MNEENRAANTQKQSNVGQTPEPLATQPTETAQPTTESPKLTEVRESTTPPNVPEELVQPCLNPTLSANLPQPIPDRVSDTIHEEHPVPHQVGTCENFMCDKEIYAACHMCNCLLCYDHSTGSDDCRFHNAAFIAENVDVNQFNNLRETSCQNSQAMNEENRAANTQKQSNVGQTPEPLATQPTETAQPTTESPKLTEVRENTTPPNVPEELVQPCLNPTLSANLPQPIPDRVSDTIHEEHPVPHQVGTCENFMCDKEIYAACHMCNCLLCYDHSTGSDDCRFHNAAFIAENVDVNQFNNLRETSCQNSQAMNEENRAANTQKQSNVGQTPEPLATQPTETAQPTTESPKLTEVRENTTPPNVPEELEQPSVPTLSDNLPQPLPESFIVDGVPMEEIPEEPKQSQSKNKEVKAKRNHGESYYSERTKVFKPARRE